MSATIRDQHREARRERGALRPRQLEQRAALKEAAEAVMRRDRSRPRTPAEVDAALDLILGQLLALDTQP